MRIDLTYQLLEITDGNKIQIASRDGRNIASVLLNPLFITEKIPGPAEGPGPDLAAAGWSLINIKHSGQTALKTYLISISQLQILVDQEKDVRGQALMEAAQNGQAGIIKSLIESGEISSKDRASALSLATKNEHIEIKSLLLESGLIYIVDARKPLSLQLRG
ncbi:MAG: hypothetical protein NTX49_06880 [Chlamydiae bacterium]|nr:hypothetical protein [Chlamydiota bacterium]